MFSKTQPLVRRRGALINNKYNKKVNMAFRNFMLNVRMRIDHFEIVGEVQITTVDSLLLKKVQHKISILRAIQ